MNLEGTGGARDYECVADWPEEVGFYWSAIAIAKAKQSQPGESKTQVSLREPMETRYILKKYNLGYFPVFIIITNAAMKIILLHLVYLYVILRYILRHIYTILLS